MEAGYQKVSGQVYKVPLGEWPKDKKLKAGPGVYS